MKLNIGCGSVKPSGWVNTDKSYKIYLSQYLKLGSSDVSSYAVVYQNLSKPWRFKSNSINIVYSSHLLEHLDRKSRELFIHESHRVLKKGGVLRVVVPDLYELSKQYIERTNFGDLTAAKSFLYWLNLHKDNLHSVERPLYKKLYDWIQNYPKQHQYMYDKTLLEEDLDSYDWGNYYYCEYGKSELIKDVIKEVENENEICSSLYLECVKK